MLRSVDQAILAAVHEMDPTGKAIVYVPERDHDVRQFKEVYDKIPARSPPQRRDS